MCRIEVPNTKKEHSKQLGVGENATKNARENWQKSMRRNRRQDLKSESQINDIGRRTRPSVLLALVSTMRKIARQSFAR